MPANDSAGQTAAFEAVGFAASPDGNAMAEDYVTASSRWRVSATGSGATTRTFGGDGGVVTWSLVGAGVGNSSGFASYFSGKTIDMATYFGFDYEAELRAAFAAWSAVANIEFVQIADAGGNFGVGSNATIRVGAAYKDGSSNVLASAFFPHSSAVGGDIVFDSGETTFWTAQSFRIVAMHEIGHSLGLNHEQANLALMNPYYNPSLGGLLTDDINGARALYGAQDGVGGTLYMPAAHPNLTVEHGFDGLRIIGTAATNVITGTDAREHIDGGAGVDFLYGLGGDDSYSVDSSFDQIFESADGGIDLVYASASYQIGAEIENLYLQGAAVQGIGNGLVNLIIGAATDNYIDGGGGADGLIGGGGNDTYMVDSSFDQIVEIAAEGTDVVYASVSYELREHLELLYLSGSAVQGFGNGLVNTITGTAGDNALSGGGGIGDVLTGNGGNDAFLFIAGKTNGTTIMDFDGVGAALGDSCTFQGFGPGALLSQDSAITWRITYNGGASVEVFNLANSATLHASDYTFT